MNSYCTYSQRRKLRWGEARYFFFPRHAVEIGRTQIWTWPSPFPRNLVSNINSSLTWICPFNKHCLASSVSWQASEPPLPFCRWWRRLLSWPQSSCHTIRNSLPKSYSSMWSQWQHHTSTPGRWAQLDRPSQWLQQFLSSSWLLHLSKGSHGRVGDSSVSQEVLFLGESLPCASNELTDAH